MEPKTLTLRKPLELAGQSWPELVLREPTAGEVKKVEGLAGTAKTLALLFRTTGVLEIALEQVGARDLREARSYLDACMAVSMETFDPLPESFTIGLDEPITVKDEAMTQITLREPTAGELKKIDALAGWAALAALVAAVSGRSIEVIDRLPVSVLIRADHYLDGFFGDAPRAGASA